MEIVMCIMCLMYVLLLGVHMSTRARVEKLEDFIYNIKDALITWMEKKEDQETKED